MIASRTLKVAAAGFVALCTSTLLGTALIASSPASAQLQADGSSPTVVTQAGTPSPAPTTTPSPTDVTWGG